MAGTFSQVVGAGTAVVQITLAVIIGVSIGAAFFCARCRGCNLARRPVAVADTWFTGAGVVVFNGTASGTSVSVFGVSVVAALTAVDPAVSASRRAFSAIYGITAVIGLRAAKTAAEVRIRFTRAIAAIDPIAAVIHLRAAKSAARVRVRFTRRCLATPFGAALFAFRAVSAASAAAVPAAVSVVAVRCAAGKAVDTNLVPGAPGRPAISAAAVVCAPALVVAVWFARAVTAVDRVSAVVGLRAAESVAGVRVRFARALTAVYRISAVIGLLAAESVAGVRIGFAGALSAVYRVSAVIGLLAAKSVAGVRIGFARALSAVYRVSAVIGLLAAKSVAGVRIGFARDRFAVSFAVALFSFGTVAAASATAVVTAIPTVALRRANRFALAVCVALLAFRTFAAASAAVVISARFSAALGGAAQVFKFADKPGYHGIRVLCRQVVPGAAAELIFNTVFSVLVIPGGVIRLAVAPVGIREGFARNPVELSFVPAVVCTEPAE